MKDFIIVSNNELIRDEYDNVQFVEGDFKDVLYAVRDLVHIGYRPITHPLPASIRMMLSPVRSILVADQTHPDALRVMEMSMDSYHRTLGQREPDYANRDDYEVIDRQLLQASIEEYKTLSN